MSPAPRPRLPGTVLLLATALAVAGCGARPARPLGEPTGVLVEVTTDLTWQYLETMSHWNPAPVSTVVITASPFWLDAPFCPPRGRYGSRYRGGLVAPYPGYYEVISADPGYQEVYLLAGDGPAQAQLFHQRLRAGHQHFLVRVRPGRTITLSVQADGNREGWAVIGHFTSAGTDGGRLHLHLDYRGSSMQAFPPPEVMAGSTDEPSGRPAASPPPPPLVESARAADPPPPATVDAAPDGSEAPPAAAPPTLRTF